MKKACLGCHRELALSAFWKHTVGKFGRRSRCIECLSEANRSWARRHRKQNRARVKRWSVSRKRGLNLKVRYGITPAEYDRLLDAQGGVCAICGLPPREMRLAVDHDHKTGRVRGLLHRRCNLGIAFFDDDPERCKAAAKYLCPARRSLHDVAQL